MSQGLACTGKTGTDSNFGAALEALIEGEGKKYELNKENEHPPGKMQTNNSNILQRCLEEDYEMRKCK